MNLSKSIVLRKHVSHKEILLFTKHLTTMLKAGIPIAESLHSIHGQSRESYLKSIVGKLYEDVSNGSSFAKALKKHGRVFSLFYISLVEIAEESGTLDESLAFLVHQLEKDFRTRKKVTSALLYPRIVVIAAFVMGSFISLFVLPRLVEFFDSFETEIPLSTKVLLFVANLMKDSGGYIFGGLVLVMILCYFLARVPFIRKRLHGVVIKIPLVGNLILAGQLARMIRNLGTLLRSGVPITKGLRITAKTVSNEVFADRLLSLSLAVDKGMGMGKTLETKKFTIFPPLVSKMVSVGEKTGNLDETLLYLADFFEDEIDDASKNLTTILEPILLLVIGLGVGFVAMAIISPIYQLTGSIR